MKRAKVRIGGWVDARLKRDFLGVLKLVNGSKAKARRLSQSGLLEKLLLEGVRRLIAKEKHRKNSFRGAPQRTNACAAAPCSLSAIIGRRQWKKGVTGQKL